VKNAQKKKDFLSDRYLASESASGDNVKEISSEDSQEDTTCKCFNEQNN
jgi:hypothetical protein